VLGDQAQQEIERALEHVEVDLEAACARDRCCVATRIAGHRCDH
jgi:enamine deaminase RidA (YjgF/YER057c/UK114 family)